MKKNENNKQSPEEILKRIEKQSSEQKKREALQILNRKDVEKPSSIDTQMMRKKFVDNWQYFVKQTKNPMYQKTAIVTCFLAFSTLIAWKIEQKYDRIRKVATRTKTYKEIQVERQNQYINQHLAGKQFKSIPIQNEIQFDPSYKYQQDNQMVMDTKQYLLEAIAKQYQEGFPIDPDMQSQLRDKGMI